jgi:hypothetical protein
MSRTNGLVFFEDEALRKIAAMSINALKFVPKTIRARLIAMDALQDIHQAVYCAAITHWKRRKALPNRPTAGVLRKERFDSLMKLVNHAVYEAVRGLIPEYKRRQVEFHAARHFFANAQLDRDADTTRCASADMAHEVEQRERDAKYSRFRGLPAQSFELVEVPQSAPWPVGQVAQATMAEGNKL